MKILIIFYLVIAMLFMAYFRSSLVPKTPEDLSRKYGERSLFAILLLASLFWPVVIIIWIISFIRESRNRS